MQRRRIVGFQPGAGLCPEGVEFGCAEVGHGRLSLGIVIFRRVWHVAHQQTTRPRAPGKPIQTIVYRKAGDRVTCSGVYGVHVGSRRGFADPGS
jgi:hypothetical protein